MACLTVVARGWRVGGSSKCMQEVEGAQLRMAEGEVRIASQLSGLTGKEGAEEAD